MFILKVYEELSENVKVAANESNVNLNIPLWLIILLGILISLSLIAIVYKIIAYRKVSIVAKKMDYLVEDLIYKSEFLTPSIEALVKLSSYVDVVETIVKNNSESLINYISNNKESAKKISSKLKEVIKEKK